MKLDIKVLVSPTERDLAEKLGDKAIVSSLCEEKGADILIYSQNGLCGIQRKKCPHDLVKSIHDGRLTKETTLLPQCCAVPRLVLEERLRYYTDGTLVSGVKGVEYRFTHRQIRKIIWECEMVKGVPVDYTEDLDDTVRYIEDLVAFMNAGAHTGLYKRPACPSEWRKPSEREEASWILQGFPGIGDGLANKIIDAFGAVPLKWACEYEDLLKVPGIGVNRAGKLWNILPLTRT